jgi:hypothetical protein
MNIQVFETVNGYMAVIDDKSQAARMADLIDNGTDYNVTELRTTFGSSINMAKIIFHTSDPKKRPSSEQVKDWITKRIG